MRKTIAWLGVTLAIAAVAGGGYAWWRSARPRVITVWVLTDYAYRQRGDWKQAVQSRLSEVNRIFAAGTGVQWKVVDMERADPTLQSSNFPERRRLLESDKSFNADVVVSFCGVLGNTGGAVVNPFSHALLALEGSEPDDRKVMRLTQALAHLFGAQVEPKGSATVMTDPPESPTLSPATIALIHRMRRYDFRNGVSALNEVWQQRAAAAIGDSGPRAGGDELVALSLQSVGRYSEALTHFRSAIKIDPKDARLRLAMAGTLQQTGDSDGALAEAREAARLDPKLTEAHVLAGAILARQGDAESAAEELQQAIQLSPNTPALYTALSGIFLSMPGGCERAIAVLKQALQVAPNSPAVETALKQAEDLKLSLASRITQARARAEQSPKDPGLLLALARAELAGAEFESAAKTLSRAIELNPNSGQAQFELARARYYRNDYAGAWAAVRAAQAVGYSPSGAFVNALKRKKPE